MSFNKELYWKRRKHVNLTRNEEGEITSADPAPLRGQTDEPPSPSLAIWTEKDAEAGKCTPEEVGRERISKIKLLRIGNQLMPFNRAQRRFRPKDRKFTKKGYHFGIKIDSHQYNLIHHLAKIQAEKHAG